ncbi:FadR/GntR family transcriptional regulator [Siculibacillus lacustris]|nr:FadR/GntR family transcriptional regulator [Siculibacillus lacustris]
MPFQPIDSQRLYQRVADQIGDMIRGGEFPPGHRLPPERDLSKSLGVSRPVVREAMIALEIAGLVEVRTGSGTYVRATRPTAPIAPIDVGHSPSDVISARLMIEGEIARIAATTASERDLAELADLVELMTREHEDGVPGEDTDLRFHMGIAAATGNAVLPTVIERLWQDQHAPVFEILSERVQLPENWEPTRRYHAAILEALQNRDPDGAAAAMRAHLAQVLAVLTGDGPMV